MKKYYFDPEADILEMDLSVSVILTSPPFETKDALNGEDPTDGDGDELESLFDD